MGEIDPLDDAIEEFENAEDITVNAESYPQKVLVKVQEEEAIGDFFRIARETGVERDATTRGALSYVELDSWVMNPE